MDLAGSFASAFLASASTHCETRASRLPKNWVNKNEEWHQTCSKRMCKQTTPAAMLVEASIKVCAGTFEVVGGRISADFLPPGIHVEHGS